MVTSAASTLLHPECFLRFLGSFLEMEKNQERK